MKHKAGEARSEKREKTSGREGAHRNYTTEDEPKPRRLGNSATQQLSDLATQQLGDSAHWHIGGSAHWQCGTSWPTSYAKTRGRTTVEGQAKEIKLLKTNQEDQHKVINRLTAKFIALEECVEDVQKKAFPKVSGV